MSTSTLGRHQRTALSPRIGKRRTSILKLNNITPDKENTDNLAGTHARAGAGGGRKSSLKGMQKRRVSFSATNDLVMFDKHAEASKKVAIKELAPAPIPNLHELLEDEDEPRFGVGMSPAAREDDDDAKPVDTADWAARHFTDDYPAPRAQTREFPERVPTVENIFGDDINESAIVPHTKRTAFVTASVELDEHPLDTTRHVVSMDVDEDEVAPQQEQPKPVSLLHSGTIDAWQGAEASRRIAKELEVTGGVVGTLDSAYLDVTATVGQFAPKTANHVIDMSLDRDDDAAPPTQQLTTNVPVDMALATVAFGGTGAGARTVNFAADMSLDTEQTDLPKTANFEMDMSLDAAPRTGDFAAAARTINIVADMAVDTAAFAESPALSRAKTTNVAVDMSLEDSQLNRGFTADWARTVNVVAPMEVEHGDEDADDGDEDEDGPQWGIKAFEAASTRQHLAAADAVRKSLEMGETRSRKSSMDRGSFGRSPARASLDAPRESLNRSSLLLSPVEETADFEEDAMSPPPGTLPPKQPAVHVQATAVEEEQEEDDDGAMREQAAELLPKLLALKKRPVEEVGGAQPQQAATLKRSAVGARGDHEEVLHPIAGTVVNAPRSKLPGIFDRRFSTRQIIREFGHDAEPATSDVVVEEEEEEEQEEEEKVEEEVVVKAVPATVEASVEASALAVVADSESTARRMSVHRQSIGGGELTLADVIFLSNIKNAEEQPVSYIPFRPKHSVHQVQVTAMEQELRILQELAMELRDAIETAESARVGPDHALFQAVTTSDQDTLHALQQDLAQLKRVCVASAEAQMMRNAAHVAHEASKTLRELSEVCSASADSTEAHNALLRADREQLRSAKMATLARMCEVEEKRTRAKPSKSAAMAIKAMQTVLGVRVLEAAQHGFALEMNGLLTMQVTHREVGFEYRFLDASGPHTPAWVARLVAPLCMQGTSASSLDDGALSSLLGPVRGQVARIYTTLREWRFIGAHFDGAYASEHSLDVMFKSPTTDVVAHVPLAALHAYPAKQVAVTWHIPRHGPAGAPKGVIDALSDGCVGLGGIVRLCTRIQDELKKL